MDASLIAVAVAALKLAAAHGGGFECHEYAGAILQTPTGSYTATAPVRGDEDNFRLAVKIPAGDKLAAIYHTHPRCHSAPIDSWFSPGDVQVAHNLGLASFIWTGQDGHYRVYVPGSTPTKDIGYGPMSAGVILDQQPLVARK